MSATAPKFRRILCPTDFSQVSRDAFDLAVLLARQAGVPLQLVHVVAELSPYRRESGIPEVMYRALSKVGRDSGRRRLAEWLDRAKLAGVRAHGVVAAGLPTGEILRVARKARADLIVMGAHGRTAAYGTGGVAERMVRFSRCPVLIARRRALPRRAGKGSKP